MTAVEWLVNELERDDSKIARVIGLKKYNFIIRLAKEMEKNSYICSKCKSQINEKEIVQQMQDSEKSD
jgi:hypothetical protein